MLFKLLRVIGLVYVGFGIYLYFGQSQMMYLQTPERHSSQYPYQQITSENEQLKIWQLSPGYDKAIIYFGGNAEDVLNNADSFVHFFPENTIYLVNYRGYGGSTGKPSETALYHDAIQVYDQIRQDHNQVYLIGRSLGSGVATYLASKRNIDGVVLVTPYDSVLAVAQSTYPFYPVKWLLKDTFDSLSRANDIHTPTLILTAENDRVIPTEHSQRLFNALPEKNRRWLMLKNTDHNTIAGQYSYWQAIRDYLNEIQ